MQQVDVEKRPDDLYQRIVGEVMCGRIRPKERLGENSLAARLGEPRASVREALMRLEQDGVVVRQDSVGTYFREIGEEELLEIYDVRLSLEPMVAASVATCVTKRELDGLEAMARRIDLSKVPDGARDTDDNAFHLRLAELSRLRHIPRLMQLGSLHVRCSLLHRQMVMFLVQSATPIARPDHRDIVRALRSQDAEKASMTMMRHLRAARALAVAQIERMRSFGGDSKRK
jgi:DNA-binding GntR family transcriptional regulator